MSLRQAYG